MNNRRLAFICHPYHRGGVTRWMADAAIAAAGQGHEVYFITVRPTRDFISAGGREQMVSLLSGTAVRLFCTDVSFFFEFGTEAYRAGVYQQLIRKHVPKGSALVLSDDEAVWAAAASVADVYRVIGVLHGDQDYYYNKARSYHRSLAVCVCVSGRIRKNAMLKCPAIDQSALVAIPCGINIPVIALRQANPVCRLIFIGRLTDYEKRAGDLVKIAAELKKQGFAFHLDIAGNSKESAIDFGAQFAAAGVAEHITFHGWQDKAAIQRLMEQSDICLLTSNSEGMPLVMMEALSCGCGFVGTRVSGIEDYESDPRAADCVGVYTVGDVPAAAAAIKHIASRNIIQRSRAARLLAEQEFSMQVCLQRYFAAIDAASPGAAVRQLPSQAGGALRSRLLAIARYVKVRLLAR